ncbi:MAG: hypothetical protein O7I42_11410 [Alphaproteobacteria bacterium]|nr:hypothetical protein [Alphaproteobacteria bacterium]
MVMGSSCAKMIAVARARDRRDLKACPTFQSRLSVFLGAYTVIGIAGDLIAFAKSLDAQTGFTDAAGPTI